MLQLNNVSNLWYRSGTTSLATHDSECLYFDESSFILEVEYPDPSAIDPVCSPLSLSQLQFFTFPLVDRPPHRDTFSSSSECHATSPSTVNGAYTREPRLSWSFLRIDASVVTVLPNFALDHKFINEKTIVLVLETSRMCHYMSDMRPASRQANILAQW